MEGWKTGQEANIRGWFYLRPLCICRLGRAYLGLCWVSFHSIQPTLCQFDCAMRNL